jgi:hypothetical protein
MTLSSSSKGGISGFPSILCVAVRIGEENVAETRDSSDSVKVGGSVLDRGRRV